MQLEPGDIILFKPFDFLSNAVAYFTNSNYSHVAMAISSEHIIEANWYKRVNVIPFQYHDRMEVYRLKGGLNGAQQFNVVYHSYKMLNNYYDYAQIIGYLLEFFIDDFSNPLNSKNLIICSELIDRAYSNIGIDLVLDKESGNVKPHQLIENNILERVY